MTTQPPRPDAEEPAIVQVIRRRFAETGPGYIVNIGFNGPDKTELLAHLDALKARASEPSERERELDAALTQLHRQVVRGPGHRSVKATLSCIENVLASRACDTADTERELAEAEAERDRLQSELAEARAAVAKTCGRCGSTGSCDADFHCATCYREMEGRSRRHFPKHQKCEDACREHLAYRFKSDAGTFGQPAAEKAEGKPERWRRFNETTGAFGYMTASGPMGANHHPDRCVCQGDEATPHKHYTDDPLHPCARCGKCTAYQAAVQQEDGKKPTEEKTMPSPSPTTIAGLHEVLSWLVEHGYVPDHDELVAPAARLHIAGKEWRVDRNWFIDCAAPGDYGDVAVDCRGVRAELEKQAAIKARPAEAGHPIERLTREEIAKMRDARAHVHGDAGHVATTISVATLRKLLSAAERDLSRAEQEEGGEQWRRLERAHRMLSYELPKSPLREVIDYLREEKRSRP
jgi:hypothetical protein